MQKRVQVETGRGRKGKITYVDLNGFDPGGALTPILARAALRSIGADKGVVTDLTPYEGQIISYRVYPNTVRKFARNIAC